MVGSSDGTVHQWDPGTGTKFGFFPDPSHSEVRSVAFNGTGHWLAWASENLDVTVMEWDHPDKRRCLKKAGARRGHQPRRHPDGDLVPG